MQQPISIAILGISLLSISSTLAAATIPHATSPQLPKSSLSLQQGSEQVVPSIRKKPDAIQVNPKVPRVKPTPIATPTPVPSPPVEHRYKVKMWFMIDNANDGFADNTIECYGELRINGELYWQIPREQAGNNKKEKGQTLEVSDSRYARKQFIFNKPKIDYEISLRDADGGSDDDDVYQGNRREFNLEFLAGQGEQVYQFRNSKTYEASRLRIRVEKL